MSGSETHVGAASAPAELDARYGRTGLRRGPWAAVISGVVLVVAALAWFIWARPVDPRTAIEWSDLSYSVQGDVEATMTWRLVVEPGREVSCALNALNTDYAIIGWRIVNVPASADAVRDITETVRTTEHAATAGVYGCWIPSEQ